MRHRQKKRNKTERDKNKTTSFLSMRLQVVLGKKIQKQICASVWVIKCDFSLLIRRSERKSW